MIKLLIDKYHRITQNKERLEKKLNVKIEHRGKEIYINGNSEDEFIAEKVLEALNFGFPFSTALLIKDEEMELVKINIKSHTKRRDLERIRGRIIGMDGKTLRALNELTKCFFELKDNEVGIIGSPEYLKIAENAIILIIKGTRQANVYAYLEHHQYEEPIDLGLKEIKKKKNK